MVMDVETSSSGMSWNRRSMSAREEIATPARATSPDAIGWSLSYPICVGRSKATGLSVAFDLPTQMGYDSDHPMASGEVARAGVAISSRADMERLFQDIPLEEVSTSMTINSTASILLAFYALVAQRQGAASTGVTLMIDVCVTS